MVTPSEPKREMDEFFDRWQTVPQPAAKPATSEEAQPRPRPQPPRREVIDYEAILRKPIWNTQDVVDYFGLESKQVIYKQIQEGKAPPRYRLGKHLKWDRAEVIAWFQEHREEI